MIRAAAIVGAVFLLLPDTPAVAQAQANWADWGGVQRFRGVASIESRGRRNWRDGVITDKADEFEIATLSFVLERARPEGGSTGSFYWVAVGPVEVQGQSSNSVLTETWDYRLRYQSSSEINQALPANSTDLRLSLDYKTGQFELLLPSTLATAVPERWSRSEWRYQQGTEVSSGENETTSFVSANFYGTAPQHVGSLSASVLRQRDASPDDPGDMSSSTVGSVQLWPEYEDVELHVSVDFLDPETSEVGERNESLLPTGWVHYDDWRPRGSVRQPGKAGNQLVAIAHLQPKVPDGDFSSPSQLPKVESMRFELVGTSREPGVAMNWPSRGADDRPDFRLVYHGNPGELDPDGQVYIVEPFINVGGYPQAGAIVESFDFGGRSELRVTAELEGGRTIYGFYSITSGDPDDDSGDRRYERLLLPKRRDGDWIAEGWRRDHDVTGLAADDDGEVDPEGDGDAGDGLTLYEEYRGFVVRRMAGSRVEGDVLRKDLFVLNLIGSDAWQGIKLFENVTDLRVISKLDRAEMDPEARIINPNHRDAPHLTEQHGIVLHKVKGTSDNYRNDLAVGKPATTRFIPMPSRREYDKAPDQTTSWIATYDMELAHRMLHAVGVADHGEGDRRLEFRVIPGSYKGNDSGRHRLLVISEGDERYADLRVERTGEYFFDDTQIERAVDNYARRRFRKSFGDLDIFQQWQMIGTGPTYRWLLGAEFGQHSGDENCPMRRMISMIYRAREPIRTLDGFRTTGTETYYWSASYDQRENRDAPWTLCELPTGTGYNDPNRRDPQPRYGNAMSGRGNCRAQICVNDAIPYR